MVVAASNGHPAVVQFLLANGADTTTTDANGWNDLHLACQTGLLEAVQLLAPKINPNNTTEEGETAIQLAAAGNHHHLVRFLMELGVKIDAKTLELFNDETEAFYYDLIRQKDLATVGGFTEALNLVIPAITSPGKREVADLSEASLSAYFVTWKDKIEEMTRHLQEAQDSASIQAALEAARPWNNLQELSLFLGKCLGHCPSNFLTMKSNFSQAIDSARAKLETRGVTFESLEKAFGERDIFEIFQEWGIRPQGKGELLAHLASFFEIKDPQMIYDAELHTGDDLRNKVGIDQSLMHLVQTNAEKTALLARLEEKIGSTNDRINRSLFHLREALQQNKSGIERVMELETAFNIEALKSFFADMTKQRPQKCSRQGAAAAST